MRLQLKVVGVVLTCLLLTTAALAQVPTGTLSGRATDGREALWPLKIEQGPWTASRSQDTPN